MGLPANSSATRQLTVRRVLEVLSGPLLGSSGGLFLVATLDAFYAAQSSDFGARWLAELGLLAPLALGLGLIFTVFRLFFHGPDSPRPLRTLAGWSNVPAAQRGERNALLLLAPLAFVFWVAVTANVATRLLGSELPARAGAASLTLAALALAWVFAQCSSSASVALSSSTRLSALSPLAAAAIGGSVAALCFALAIWTGTPSGAGGPLALFGVFKRPELDLRAPGLLIILAVSAYLAPAPRPPSRALAVLFAFALLALTARAAGTGLERRSVALGIEREAPLAKILLRLFRKVSDRDHDGYARRFGGGDCDDHDAGRNPGAIDVPGNGRDEDCSGEDERASAPPLIAAKATTDARKSLPERLNVVLISIDTLRADLQSKAGGRSITPNLERLSQDSVVFDRAYSLASYTAKSVGPFLLGKYSSETHRGWSHFNRFSSRDVFVAQRLQQANVHTVSVQGFWYFFMNTGLERGFDWINKSAAPAQVSVDGDSTTNSDKLSDAAIAELAKPELLVQPFFMWIHYVDPHAEYVAHEGFDFGPSSRQRYDGEVAFVDYHLGRVLDALEKSLVYDHTVVIVTSDHGEAFGEHGMIRHGFELWEELVRVPLIVRVPGVPPRRFGARRSAIDLAPTILDLSGVPVPPADDPSPLSGVSLVPILLLRSRSRACSTARVHRHGGRSEQRRAPSVDRRRSEARRERRSPAQSVRFWRATLRRPKTCSTMPRWLGR